MTAQKKDAQIVFKLSTHDKNRLIELANKHTLSLSTFCRFQLLKSIQMGTVFMVITGVFVLYTIREIIIDFNKK